MGLREYLQQRPLFTRDEVKQHLLGAEKSRSPQTVDSLLAYHLQQGHILRIRRGLYAVVPPGADAAQFLADPYLIAAKAAPDAVLAYHTSLELHGRAYSSFATFYFLTELAARPFQFRHQRFQPVALPKALRTQHRRTLGVEKQLRDGLTVHVTSLERSLVDMLDRIDLAGGWEEAWRSLEMIEYFDLDAVIKFALALGNDTTNAKVGYFLEAHQQQLMVEQSHLKKLEKHRPKQPRYLQRNGSENSLDKRWNLIVPDWLANRTWEER